MASNRTKGILLLGDERLKQKALELVNFTNLLQFQQEIDTLTNCLKNFRKEHGFGRGIAGPQIGLPLRIISLALLPCFKHLFELTDSNLLNLLNFNSDETNKDDVFCLVNPTLLEHSEESFTLYDDCFSLPDLMIRVRRWKWISISFELIVKKKDGWEFYREKEEIKTFVMEKMSQDISELLQHEMDHLDGVLMLDKAEHLNEELKDGVVYRDVYLSKLEHFRNKVDFTY
ncbi:hypothetical protein ABK040_006337 [Willaertia magna]